MKKIFLEYLNELIYMLKEYENSWWVDWMEKAYTKYRDEDSIEKFLDAFGGMGSFRGSIIAACVLTLLPEVLRGMKDYRMLIYSIVLIAMMLFNWAPKAIEMRQKFAAKYMRSKKKSQEE